MRNDLAEILGFEYGVKPASGDDFDRLVHVVHDFLPGDLDYPTVYESCRHLAGVRLHPAAARLFAHRVAGNLPLLKRHRPVLPWSVPEDKEWVPLQVVSCKRRRNSRGRLGGDFRLLALAGRPAGLYFVKWWSFRYCRYIAPELKFSRPVSRRARSPARYPFSALEQLVTLRFYGLIDPAECGPGEPGFQKVGTPPSLAAWNRGQIRRRFRIDDGYECPDDRPRSFPCHNCPRGYSSCPAGTHARDYVQGFCKVCQDDAALFDPDWPPGVCVFCQRRSQSRMGGS